MVGSKAQPLSQILLPNFRRIYISNEAILGLNFKKWIVALFTGENE
ncbi:hypothetical protein GRFL_0713 [Christiangramia flava JLT2011]|uniref:Uncharacterized protein n=1 Tax=Christiangramia flava JLT2011 TaxID=1229726 RepID=A0A1L7I1E9_9FLAO|nr:hypothetical protein GRFL_0713 [Christiangramia flava JLT2011]